MIYLQNGLLELELKNDDYWAYENDAKQYACKGRVRYFLGLNKRRLSPKKVLMEVATFPYLGFRRLTFSERIVEGDWDDDVRVGVENETFPLAGNIVYYFLGDDMNEVEVGDTIYFRLTALK